MYGIPTKHDKSTKKKSVEYRAAFFSFHVSTTIKNMMVKKKKNMKAILGNIKDNISKLGWNKERRVVKNKTI